MKKSLIIPLIAIIGLSSCNKEEATVEPKQQNNMTYKIQPAKIGELKQFSTALQEGLSLRLAEESYTEEEFWLYTEAVVNSMVVDFTLTPDITEERQVLLTPEVTEFNTANLVQVIVDFQQAILADLSEVSFDEEGEPYVHIVDVIWDQGSTIEILYLAGLTTGVSSVANNTFQMSWATNSNCDFYALDGHMQSIMHNYWNNQPTFAGQYRPNYLYSPPLWTQGYVPCCWTYTEVQTRVVDYANVNDRPYYAVGPYLSLWHRTMYSTTAAPACLPDVVDTWPRSLAGHANGTAFTGVMLNPNPYDYNINPNGLVLVAFSIVPQAEEAWKLGISSPHPARTEHWHRVSFTYGRQIPDNVSNY